MDTEVRRKLREYFREPTAFEMFFLGALRGSARKLVVSMERKLKLAGSPRNPALVASSYIASLSIGVLIGLVVLIVGIQGLNGYFLTKSQSLLILGMVGTMFGLLIPVVTYIMLNLGYSNEIDKRRVGFDSEVLPFSALFVIYLRTSFSPRVMFESLGKVRAFAFISQFTSYVANRIRYFGESVEQAILKSLETVPSKVFYDLMSTYVAAVRTGAPVIETIKTKMNDILDQFKLRANSAANTLSGLGETYVIWLASGFITIFLIVILSAILPSLISVPLGVVYLMALVLVPAMNLVFVLMVEQAQMRFPERSLTANKLGMIMVGLAFVLMIVFLIIAGYIVHSRDPFTAPSPYSLVIDLFTANGTAGAIVPTVIAISAAFIVTSIPPYIKARRELKEGTGYDEHLVKFLYSLAEGIRSGLPPETLVRNLSNSKELGKIASVLRIIDAYTKLGVPIKDAFRKGAEKIIDFSSRIALSTLADMIEIGNLTPEIIQTLANMLDTQIKIRRDYYSKIRILIAMPYVGIVIAILATLLMSVSIQSILFSSQNALYGPLAQATVLIPKAMYLISISAVFNAYTAGFLVGKLQTGKIATGFLHSIILVAITSAMVIISLEMHITLGGAPSNLTL
ncbi:MAG: type II secretion system F family protein [Thermoprotei archaeon]